MTVLVEKNKKSEVIKKLLNGLLIELERKKQIISFKKSYIYIDDKIAPFIPGEKLELLDVATSQLINLIDQFHSVDDFNSVKKLRETEIFFNYDNLKNFTFPSYALQIDPILLNYVNLEIEIDGLNKKAKELLARGHEKAGTKASLVVLVVRKLIKCHFQEGINDNLDYKANVLAVIDEAKSVLKQHRGCKKILINILALISTLGIAFLVNKCLNNRYLFFPETKSFKQIIKLEHTMTKLAI